MSGWELVFFVASVVTAFLLVVGVAWYRQWRRDPERFKNGFRFGPHRGGPMGGPPGKGW